MTEPTAQSAVKRLAMANGNTPGTLRPRQLYTDNAINKKTVKTGSQMSAEYEYMPSHVCTAKKTTIPPNAAMKMRNRHLRINS